jgi:two-component system sensor histidine kinase/response regulator
VGQTVGKSHNEGVILSSAVLINVDDHAPARYARTRVLRQAGFIVHDAGTGSEALRLVAEVQPDLVLLDVHLPDVNGVEVCRQIKNNEQMASVIVVQISASAISAPQAATALNTGADTYLIEPVDPDFLVATVRAFLRLRAAERALAGANQELSEKNLELHQLNQALRRSNDDLEHFAYVASHDLQEPLRNITTHIQLLERIAALRFNEAERQLFGVVVDSAQRMRMLIHDVLAYSRIGKETPRLERHDLRESLETALENVSEAVTACGATVSAEFLPAVIGDGSQLSRVFQNLIGNSIKYRTPGLPPVVGISAVRDGAGDWVISVRDNGIGISKDHFDKIFQPFKRLHSHQIPGNGIGLALCRRIVEGHGGRIWVESQEGEGAIFSFTLRPSS